MIVQTKRSTEKLIKQDTLLSSSESQVINPEIYFDENKPPENLTQIRDNTIEFIKKNKQAGRPIVLVTSGGTTVPLENNTVRFIDNFSAGTRGASSTEEFLKKGYGVIFLHRKHSLQPFNRHYTVPENGFLDFFNIDESGRIQIKGKYEEVVRNDILTFTNVISTGKLYMPYFTTLSDYLFILREVTLLMAPMNQDAMFYLAAAVSDFFIPAGEMVEHKIQSSDGDLILKMNQVPKFLRPLVNSWAPKSFVVSFKVSAYVYFNTTFESLVGMIMAMLD
ncbi:Phosphopantothenate-cysteine ligase 2 [Zancudomyces culisetae]|uniref:Phosphopantothenate-cysteine ligase 2 n=1 Tax=Zancudomyces culisetae TaxID=1213189 RepID=A0A1R1PQE8_ZANCU|nr:Phosphopantothenate-cysteine ligase 2 [Zancudomyces culisetae]OMH83187.1 Phosphopantothenate-cysteine ligase 2 [Zancudomyces culisetae]|eukprot:OMH80345.1 Phosphopantothenate-cysteine ligase 2 [Zancudomyces culisetae]